MSGEQIGIHNQGNWSPAKNGGGVVSDQPGGGVPGAEHTEYYGGYLICESIGRSNIPIVAACPKMLKALIGIRRKIMCSVDMSDEMTLIDDAIAAATTPITPVQSQPVPEPAVKYEDIAQHDIFVAGDQYQDVCRGSEKWINVKENIGCPRSQSSLRNVPCRRPVKQSPVEPVADQACQDESQSIEVMSPREWLELRRDELYEGVMRCLNSTHDVPPCWLQDLAALEGFLQDDSGNARIVFKHPDHIGAT